MTAPADGLVSLLLAGAVLALGAMLLRQLGQRRQLQRWLADPGQNEIPEGSGAWRDIFSLLQRWRKEDQRARKLLGGNLDRFHQAAQALPDGVILLDPEGHIVWLNRAAGEHFGLDPARDVGTVIGQLVRQSGFHELYAAFRAGETVKPVVMETAGSEPRRVLSLSLLSFADTGILLLSRDITEISRAEAVRRDFIANVSHELRTPLTVICGFLEHLTAGDAAAEASVKGSLALMAGQARRMNRLVEDLLTLTRLENAAEPPRDDPVDVPELLEGLLAEARALSQGRHVIELGRVDPVGLRGSSGEVQSAFGNLVSNAIRYTPDGGRVGLSWVAEGDRLVFAVADSGIGIPPEHIPRLTERFYRVDKGRSANTGGTGLGLAIVKHVLARHQGTLGIKSAVGRGSTFSACFPAERKLALDREG